MGSRLLFALLVLAVTAAWLPKAAQAETSYLMGSLGDSISAGTFADESAAPLPGDNPTWEQEFPVSPSLYIPFLGETDNRNTYSWASGNQLRSHVERLREWLQPRGATLEVANVSEPGASTDAIPGQADRLVETFQSGHYDALTYVTILAGANDACASTSHLGGTPASAMAASLFKALAKLAAIPQSEPVHVLISSLPNIPALARPDILALTTAGGLSCHWLRDNILHACSGLLTWQSKQQYAARVSVIAEKNRMLKQVVEAANRRFPRLRVSYSDRFYQAEILPGYLARDCFHPNRIGQQLISDDLWQDQPWFK